MQGFHAFEHPRLYRKTVESSTRRTRGTPSRRRKNRLHRTDILLAQRNRLAISSVVWMGLAAPLAVLPALLRYRSCQGAAVLWQVQESAPSRP